MTQLFLPGQPSALPRTAGMPACFCSAALGLVLMARGWVMAGVIWFSMVDVLTRKAQCYLFCYVMETFLTEFTFFFWLNLKLMRLKNFMSLQNCIFRDTPWWHWMQSADLDFEHGILLETDQYCIRRILFQSRKVMIKLGFLCSWFRKTKTKTTLQKSAVVALSVLPKSE